MSTYKDNPELETRAREIEREVDGLHCTLFVGLWTVTIYTDAAHEHAVTGQSMGLAYAIELAYAEYKQMKGIL